MIVEDELCSRCTGHLDAARHSVACGRCKARRHVLCHESQSRWSSQSAIGEMKCPRCGQHDNWLVVPRRRKMLAWFLDGRGDDRILRIQMLAEDDCGDEAIAPLLASIYAPHHRVRLQLGRPSRWSDLLRRLGISDRPPGLQAETTVGGTPKLLGFHQRKGGRLRADVLHPDDGSCIETTVVYEPHGRDGTVEVAVSGFVALVAYRDVLRYFASVGYVCLGEHDVGPVPQGLGYRSRRQTLRAGRP